jgi:hypothetical protein
MEYSEEYGPNKQMPEMLTVNNEAKLIDKKEGK